MKIEVGSQWVRILHHNPEHKAGERITVCEVSSIRIAWNSGHNALSKDLFLERFKPEKVNIRLKELYGY